ncbi:mediator of RNA polymerase II transcription subunit 31 [Calypte anna]|uniref:mediator of RNA polymerase II transcription subunit 31 n=2 Tax=Neoaves TaxID=3078114 RepID=UPI0011C408F5|nr:mediator of RNA polymerase II transcription subunit 31 [Calypte anna]
MPLRRAASGGRSASRHRLCRGHPRRPRTAHRSLARPFSGAEQPSTPPSQPVSAFFGCVPVAAILCGESGAARRAAMETDDAGNRLRFQLELEFVQCLANPNYLNFLAQRGYFKDKAFVNYLKYLLYWKEPEYAKYLKYPQCLHMLELLQYEHFRKELVNAQCAKFIDEQQILHWQHYSRKRMRLQQALAEQQQQNNTSVK